AGAAMPATLVAPTGPVTSRPSIPVCCARKTTSWTDHRRPSIWTRWTPAARGFSTMRKKASVPAACVAANGSLAVGGSGANPGSVERLRAALTPRLLNHLLAASAPGLARPGGRCQRPDGCAQLLPRALIVLPRRIADAQAIRLIRHAPFRPAAKLRQLLPTQRHRDAHAGPGARRPCRH